MKLKFTLFFTLMLAFQLGLMSQGTLVAGWTFPGNSAVADTGLAINLDKEITTMGGTSALDFKNGYTTKAAQVTEWQDGMDAKAWVIAVSTEGYESLTISSRQQSGGNEPGPKDYKLQFSVDLGSSWTDVESGAIAVENDWETSFVENLPLPEDCDNQSELMIRWVMTTNEASGGAGTVLESGKSKIDEIFVRGEIINAVGEIVNRQIAIGPNPATDYISIQSNDEIKSVMIFDINGRLVNEVNVFGTAHTIDLSGMEKGLYFISLLDRANSVISSEKIVIQ